MQGNVERLAMEELRVAYVRYTGAYTGLAAAFPGLVQKLMDFAGEQDLLRPGFTRFLSIYHDNHEITNERQLRTSFCMTIPDRATVKEDHEVGCMLIPSGEYAVGHFDIFQSQFGAAWDFMYREWLFNSSFQPRDSFPFELYLNDASSHPLGKHWVDIYLPIEPIGA